MVTLETSKLFRNLNAVELNALGQIAQELAFSPGQPIFKEGDPGDGVYMLKDGMVEISASVANNTERAIAQVHPGELFGEMAVLEVKPRSATARAAQNSAAYFIPRDELLAMVQRSPVLALELLREISQRLREFNQRYIQEMLQAERLSVIGRFARSIIHDLKNPLNIIGLWRWLLPVPKHPALVEEELAQKTDLDHLSVQARQELEVDGLPAVRTWHADFHRTVDPD